MHEQDPELPRSSSIPQVLAPAREACYREVLDILSGAGVPFAVGGAFALHEHCGIWRKTKDLDLMLEAASIPKALEYLDEAGFTTYIKDPVWLAKVYRGRYFVDLITGVGNALLPVDSSWIDRSSPYELFGVPCRVMAVEELLVSKLFVCRRERFDGADVAHLLRAAATRIDWQRIESLLDENWELLLWALIFFSYIYPARRKTVPDFVWTTLLTRFSSAPFDPAAPFRGSLIDPNMFAIDVNEWGERDTYREACLKRLPLLKSGQVSPAQPDSAVGSELR